MFSRKVNLGNPGKLLILSSPVSSFNDSNWSYLILFLVACTPNPGPCLCSRQEPSVHKEVQLWRWWIPGCLLLGRNITFRKQSLYFSIFSFEISSFQKQRNWFFDTISDFLIPISLPPYVVDLRYFKLSILQLDRII